MLSHSLSLAATLLGVIVSLGHVTLLAQTHPSTPTDALKALIDAIERDDAAKVGELIELPVKLERDELALIAQRYILGSKLYWLLEDKFAQRDAQRVMRLARLDYLPRVDPHRLNWRMHEVHNRPGVQEPKEGAIGSDPDLPQRFVRMAKADQGWKANLDHGLPALLVLDVQDAPWRNRVMQRVTDELKAGMLATIDQVIDGLVPRPPPQPEPVKADRSTPAGAILVAAEAIEKWDVETLADSFEMIGGDDNGAFRRMAEQMILERKVEKAVRARFAPDQAERIVQEGSLRPGRPSHLAVYQNVEGWAVDGDVARGALKEPLYDVVRRMVRRDGIWRIQYPPRSTIASLNDPEERRKQQARMTSLQELLDHPDRFATAGDVLEMLEPTRKEVAAQQADAGAEARKQLEEMRREMAKNPPQTPEEAEEHALALAFWEMGTALASKDAKEAAKYYFAEGDNGSYALARQNRLLAVIDLKHAVSREIGESDLVEFDLTNLADDIYGLFMTELKIQGDRAVPTGETHGEWIPPIRKIAGQWKIDVSEEAAGNPKESAKRADEETKKIRELTAQVKAGRFTNMDQLRKAMMDAGIKGLGTPR